jgi:hypothetical protein
MRRLWVLATIAIFAGCTTTNRYVSDNSAAAVTAPQIKVGDFWEYAVRDGYTGIPQGIYRYDVSQIDGDRVIVTLTNNGAVLDTLIYDKGWNGRELPLTPLHRFRFDPSSESFLYPLEPGKSWNRVVSSTDVGTGRHFRTHVHAKVIGWERISVPAGQFDALKVQREVFAGNMEGSRTQEEIRETDWYVPSVRRSVMTQRTSQHFDTSRGGGDGGGEYPLRIRGDWLIGELVAYSH